MDDDSARELRGFGPLGILAMVTILAGNVIVLPLSAILVLVWARLSRTPWREIGFVRPRSWALGRTLEARLVNSRALGHVQFGPVETLLINGPSHINQCTAEP